MTNIILSPIITEKSMKAAEAGKYSFFVYKFASKPAIKQAVAGMFKVHAINVFTVVCKGKRKRIGTRRVEVADSIVKKAIVQLRPGEKIGLFEPGGAQSDEEEARSKTKKEDKDKDKKGEEKKLKL